MKTQATVWEEVSKLLREARRELPLNANAPKAAQVPAGPLVGTLTEFEEFLSHNELGTHWLASRNAAILRPPSGRN